MNAKQLPDLDTLNKLLHLDPLQGILIWKPRVAPRRFNSRYAGMVAGSVKPSGYVLLSINNVVYRAHRIIWKMVTGLDPIGDIDHKNGNRSFNAISNLRDIMSGDNQRNMGISKANTSGHIGVSWCKKRSAWVVNIGKDGRQLFLGSFVKKTEAIEIRKVAEKKMRYYVNHGNIRQLYE